MEPAEKDVSPVEHIPLSGLEQEELSRLSRECVEHRSLVESLLAEEDKLLRAIRKKKLVERQEQHQQWTETEALQQNLAGIDLELSILQNRAELQTQELSVAMGRLQAETDMVKRLKTEQEATLEAINEQEQQLKDLRSKVILYTKVLRNQQLNFAASKRGRAAAELAPEKGKERETEDPPFALAPRDISSTSSSSSMHLASSSSKEEEVEEEAEEPKMTQRRDNGEAEKIRKKGRKKTKKMGSFIRRPTSPRGEGRGKATDSAAVADEGLGKKSSKKTGSLIRRPPLSPRSRKKAVRKETKPAEAGENESEESARDQRFTKTKHTKKKRNSRRSRGIVSVGKQGSLEGPEGGGALIAAVGAKYGGDETEESQERRRTLRAKVTRARKASIRNLNRFRKRDGRGGGAGETVEGRMAADGDGDAEQHRPQFRTIYRRKTAQQQGLVHPDYAPLTRSGRSRSPRHNLHRLRSPEGDDDAGYHSAPEERHSPERDRITPRQREAIHAIHTSKAVRGRRKVRSRSRSHSRGPRGRERDEDGWTSDVIDDKRGFSRDW